MTALRKMRKAAEVLVIVFAAWEVAAIVVSLAVVLLVIAQGSAPSPDRLIQVVGTLGLYGFILCAIRDARGRRRRRPPERAATGDEPA